MTEFEHVTVLLNEAVEGLNIKPDGVYVDCTLGGGGHTKKILSELSEKGRLYSFDQDQTAIDYNEEQLKNEIEKGRLTLIKSNFRNIASELEKRDVLSLDGIIYDLGVSSPQFDVGERGFSYQHDAVLDMRMDQTNDLTAETIVNEWSYNDLVRIFVRYGEEKFAKSIARRIEKARQNERIKTTGQLVELIKEGIPAKARRKGGHPAKKVFQAIRIAVNDELGVLEESLEEAFGLLSLHGRISVITFQSLEDRLVKSMFREKTSLPELPPGLPVIPWEMQPEVKYQMNNTAIKKVEKKQSIRQASKKNQQKLVYQIDVMSVKMFLMSAIVAIVILVVATTIISMNNKITKTQTEIARIEQKTKALNNENEDLKLKAADLMSNSRLEKIAEKAGLNLNDNNMRNVK